MSKEAMKLALEALLAATPVKAKDPQMQAVAIVALQEALAEPQQEPVAWVDSVMEQAQVFASAWSLVGGRFDSGNGLEEAKQAKAELRAMLATPPAVQEPVAMRMPKVGDRVVCIDDESLGTVVYLTAGGSPEIKFDDGSHGTYMLREFADLFGYTTPPAQPAPVQEPVGNWIWSWLMDWCKLKGISPATQDSLFAMVKDARNKFESTTPAQEFICSTGLCHYKPAAAVQPTKDVEISNMGKPFTVKAYTTPPAAQRKWVGLTDEERTEIRREHYARTLPLMDAVEAKLREKNT
jgi:hypothetical protein